MKIIEQTNRTIDFQEYNPNKLDLLTLIGDVKGLDSLDDDKINEINRELLVGSFQEFLTKFEPVVYSYYNTLNQTVTYTLKKPDGIADDSITEIPVDQNNDFIQMILSMIDAKGANGLKNADFNFENITNMITPEKVVDDIKQVRKEIHYLYDQYAALEDGDPKKLDMGDKLNEKFEVASKSYGNVMAMLPLAIEDIKTRLLLGASDSDSAAEEVKTGMLTMGEDGELKIVENPKSDTTELAVIEDSSGAELAEYFAEDYEAVSETYSDYVKELVVRTFAPLPMEVEGEVNYELEIQNYNSYLEFYKQSKDSFIKTVKPLVEKIVGVKLFFDQYQTKTKEMQPKLLICNTRLEMLTKASNLPRLETYLNTVNNKNSFENTIWYGIVSNVDLNTEGEVKVKRQRFKGNEKVEKNIENTIESVASLLNILKDYKVQLFFNFETSEETTFDHLSTKGVTQYVERCKQLMKKDYSAYAIVCYPNFTIIPKNKSGVLLDRRMVQLDNGAALSQEKEDFMRLWIEGVYVGAAYVAAGISAAWQCPSYLKNFYKSVSKEYPGVRYDIEAGDHALRTITMMSKEISGFTNNVKNEINRLNFGFAFASENANYKNNDISKITVYKARSLAEGPNGFEETYKTQVSTYVERILRYKSNDFKMDNIVHFFSNNPESTRSIWMSQKGSINSIVQDGDDLNFKIDNEHDICEVDLMFNGNVKNLEVEINKSVNHTA